MEIRGLRQVLGEKTVLQGVDLVVEPGEILGYLGPNGAGKSTTMRVLTGQLAPTAGVVKVLGVDVGEDPQEVRRRVAYVPESGPVYDVLTALEFLELVGNLRELDPGRVSERSRDLLKALDLEEVTDRPLWTFSRGMKQRVVLASAFLHDPELVLLDEPLYGLDVQTVLLVKEIIRGLATRGISVVYCSHLLDVVQQLATRVVILHQGKVVAEGPPQLLREGQPDASLEELFRELTMDREVTDRAELFLANAVSNQDGSHP